MRSSVALLALITACGQSSGAGVAAKTDASTGDSSTRDSGGDGPAIDGGATTRVRIMAANLTSGTQQAYDTPGIDIFQGLHPDVVLIQEFNYAGGDLRGLVDTAFGKDFSFYVEPRTGGIPDGVVSRFPILESGVWADASAPDRAFAYARIDVPGPIDLWAVSVHLLTSGATERSTEATQLLGYVKATVPPADYLVIAGDFNTDTPTEPAMTTLSAVVGTAPPYPADQSGNANSSINRNHPHDWVLVSPALAGRQVPVAIGAASFPAGLVFDSRVYTPLGDVPPIVVGDSAASGMQHMPVLRDFGLGGG